MTICNYLLCPLLRTSCNLNQLGSIAKNSRHGSEKTRFQGAAINKLTGGVGQKGGGVAQLFFRRMGGSLNFFDSGWGGRSTFSCIKCGIFSRRTIFNTMKILIPPQNIFIPFSRLFRHVSPFNQNSIQISEFCVTPFSFPVYDRAYMPLSRGQVDHQIDT